MTWTNLSGAFGYGTKLTSSQMQQLRDNLTALANGDSGAPAIQAAALDSASVTTAKIADGDVTEAKMAYLVGEVTQYHEGESDSFYRVRQLDGSNMQCCPTFDDSP